MKKTLLFHDTFLMKGGAERMNIEIAKILDADIATTIWHEDCYNPLEMDFRGKIFEVQKNFRRGMIGFLKMKLAFIFAKICSKNIKNSYCKNWQYENPSENFPSKSALQKENYYCNNLQQENFRLSEYENVFLSNEAISVVWSLDKNQKKFYYAHSISRHLFDLYDEYLAKVPRFAKIPYRIMAYFLRKLYIAELQKMDAIFTNSPANQKRLKKWCNVDSLVLFPPVDTEKFSYPKKLQYKNYCKNWHLEEKNYYISFARLTHAKGIDKIIDAFKQNPDKNILILFGKNDSQREEFMRLASLKPSTEQDVLLTSEKFLNISFLFISDNNTLPELISHAKATICMSQNEDFGMVAIESMACGVPVIAPNEWGYKETILDGKTGFLLRENSTKNLQNFLQNTHEKILETMQENCRIQAEKFSLKNFEKTLEKYFHENEK